MTPEPVGLYVHIPFCRSKCAYCDFVSYPGMTDVWPHYLEALVSEIAAMAPLRPRTLYIGGGTPTAWPVEHLEAVIAAARLAGLPETAEVTVEANPGTVSAEALQRLWHAGCNRLSIGVQSTFERSLRLLGRIHSFEDARAAVRWARRAGFGNVSIDLIYGLPGQSESEWLADLERAVALGVEHLSAYALTLEAGTPMARAIASGALPEPDPDVVADMYEAAEDALAGHGFVQYEISNWARRVPGRCVSDPEDGEVAMDSLLTCEHNLVYWRNEPYLGVGAGAHSSIGGKRFARVPDPLSYVRASPFDRVSFSETIDPPLEMAETAILALRLTSGLSRQCFRARFGLDPMTLYGAVFDRMERLGLLEAAGDRVRLTRRGRLLSNEVFQLLLPD